MDAIVVFGRVPDKAYLPLQLAMASRRMRPKIVRFDPNETCRSASDTIPSADGSSADLDDEAFNKLYEQYASEAFDQVFVSSEMVAAVKAVVLPEPDGSSQHWKWALERLPEAASCYTAHKSESDDSFWLSGVRDDQLAPDIEYYSNFS